MIVECPGCRYRYDVSGHPAGARARCRCGAVFEVPAPARQASYLQCPQCAAAVSPNDTRCEYCTAALLVRTCPRCLGKMFHGHQHCGYCGAELGAPAAIGWDHADTTRPCPACRHPDRQLRRRVVETIALEECDDCGGTFVDAATLERVVSDRRLASATAAAGLRAAPAQIAARASGQSPRAVYLQCPVCSASMNRTNYARISGVIVQVCARHGVWFELDGLPRLIEFVAVGGLERAARREYEDQREQLRAARARAAAERVRDEIVHGYTDPRVRRERAHERLARGLAEVLRGRRDDEEP